MNRYLRAEVELGDELSHLQSPPLSTNWGRDRGRGTSCEKRCSAPKVTSGAQSGDKLSEFTILQHLTGHDLKLAQMLFRRRKRTKHQKRQLKHLADKVRAMRRAKR